MLPFYGRKLSRKTKNFCLNELEKCKFFFNEEKFKKLKSKLIFSSKRINLEIGFGMGDHLVFLSQKLKNEVFLAVDPFLSGNVNLKKKIEINEIKNVYYSNLDFLSFLNLSKKILFKDIFVLFPDPWPKTKHQKRRLINEKFVEKVNKVINCKSRVLVATDHRDYSNQILKCFTKQNLFENNLFSYQSLTRENLNFFPTKYFYKAKREKRDVNYFIFTKKKN